MNEYNQDSLSPGDLFDFNFGYLYNVLRRNTKYIFIITTIGFLISLSYSFLSREKFRASFQIVLTNKEVDSNLSKANKFLSSQGQLSSLISFDKERDLETEVKILESSSILKPIYYYIKDYYKSNSFLGTFDLSFNQWKKDNLLIFLERNTSVLNISYDDYDQALVINVLNKVSNAYQDYSGRDRIKTLSKSIDNINDQISIYKSKSANSLVLLEDYALKNNIPFSINYFTFGSTDQSQLSDGFISKLENERLSASLKKRDYMLKLSKIKKLWQEGRSDQYLSEKMYFISSTIPELTEQRIPQTLLESNTKISELKSKFSPNDPLFIEAVNRRNFLLSTLRDQSIAYLETMILEADYIISLSRRPRDVLVRFKELYRETFRLYNTLSYLENEHITLLLELARNQDPWELISTPTLEDDSISPRKIPIIFSSTLLTFILSVFYFYYKEKESSIIYDEKQFKKLLPFNLLKTINKIEIESLEKTFFNLSAHYLKNNTDQLCIMYFSKSKISNTYIQLSNIIDKLSPNLFFTNDIETFNSEYIYILVFESGDTLSTSIQQFLQDSKLMNPTIIGYIILN